MKIYILKSNISRLDTLRGLLYNVWLLLKFLLIAAAIIIPIAYLVDKAWEKQEVNECKVWESRGGFMNQWQEEQCRYYAINK